MLLGLFYTNRLPFFSLAKVIPRARTASSLPSFLRPTFLGRWQPNGHLPTSSWRFSHYRGPTHQLLPVPQVFTLPPSRKSTPAAWCRRGLPRRPCLSSGNKPFARGQWDSTLKAPLYHAPEYLLLRSGPDGTSTFRCPRPSASLPSEQYLWATGSAPKKGAIRF